MHGRLYDARLGQFMSADPEIQAPFGQGLNRFAYAFNSPLNYVDPSGFNAEENEGAAIGIGVAYFGGLAATVLSGGGAAGAAVGGVGTSFAAEAGIGAGAAASPAAIAEAAGPGLGAASSLALDVYFTGRQPTQQFLDQKPSTRSSTAGGSGPPALGRTANGQMATSPTQEAAPIRQAMPAPDLSVPDSVRGPDRRLAQSVPGGYCRKDGPCRTPIYIMIPEGDLERAGAAIANALSGALQRLQKWLRPAAARAAAEAVKVGDYTLTRTVAGKLAERPYLNSPLTLREIMAAGKPIADPGGVAGALRWDVSGTFRGAAGNWELVVEPQSKTVLHWLFKSAPKAVP